MHFRFALELSDIDLGNIDLLHTHLDLLVTDIPSKYFVALHSILKISSTRVQDMSSRRLQDMSSRRLQQNPFSSSKTTWKRLGRRKIVTLKTCWRRLQDMSWTRVEDVFKTNKCLLGMFYCDEFVSAKPLGNKVKKYKISALYFVIGNLPKNKRAMLSSIN